MFNLKQKSTVAVATRVTHNVVDATAHQSTNNLFNHVANHLSTPPSASPAVTPKSKPSVVTAAATALRRGLLGLTVLLFANTAFAQATITITHNDTNGDNMVNVGETITIPTWTYSFFGTDTTLTPALYSCASASESDPAANCGSFVFAAVNPATAATTYTITAGIPSSPSFNIGSYLYAASTAGGGVTSNGIGPVVAATTTTTTITLELPAGDTTPNVGDTLTISTDGTLANVSTYRCSDASRTTRAQITSGCTMAGTTGAASYELQPGDVNMHVVAVDTNGALSGYIGPVVAAPVASISLSPTGEIRLPRTMVVTATNVTNWALYRCTSDETNRDLSAAADCSEARNQDTSGAPTYALTIADDAGMYMIAQSTDDRNVVSSAQGPIRTTTAPTGGTAQTLNLNAGGAIDTSITSDISDADTASAGDQLRFSVSVSDAPLVASAVINESSGVLSVTPRTSRGTANFTITGTDRGGETAEQSVTVNVNTAPIPDGATIASIDFANLSAANQTRTAGFTDTGDTIASCRAEPSGASAASVMVVGATVSGMNCDVEISAVARTSADVTISVYATDDGLPGVANSGLESATAKTFTVSVGNSVPAAPSTAPANITSLPTGSTNTSTTVAFTDADMEALTISASSSNESIATVAVMNTTHSGASTSAEVHVTGVARNASPVTITVEATDNQTGTTAASTTFMVTVTNADPEITSTAETLTPMTGQTGLTSQALTTTDADSDTVTYSITTPGDTAVVDNVNIDNGTGVVTFNAVAIGNTSITITADDGMGGTDTVVLSINVGNAPPVFDNASNNLSTVELHVTETSNGTFNHTVTVAATDADSAQSITYSAAVTTGSTNVADVNVGDNTVGMVTVNAGNTQGTVTVTVTASDSAGGSDTTTFNVEVNAAPTRGTATLDAMALKLGVSTTTANIRMADFTDTDDARNTLRYSEGSSNPQVATVAVNDGTGEITVTPVGQGSTTITVSAFDRAVNGGIGNHPDGLRSEAQTFTVTVNANPALAITPDADVTIQRGDGADTSQSITFTDNDVVGGGIDTVTTSEGANPTGIVNVSRDAGTGQLTLTPVGVGETTVTVTATDNVTGNDADGNALQGTLTHTFTVTVNEAPVPGTDTIDTVRLSTLGVGATATQAVAFSDTNDPNGDNLSYWATSGDTAVVVVTSANTKATAVKGNNVIALSVANPPTAGTDIVITVHADDEDDGTAMRTFMVTVTANAIPVVITQPTSLDLAVGGGTRTVDAAFRDDDNIAGYDVSGNTNSAVASATVSNTTGEVTVTPIAQGTTTFTIEATDGVGQKGTTTFVVNVNANPVITGSPAATLSLDNSGDDAETITVMFTDDDVVGGGSDTLTFTNQPVVSDTNVVTARYNETSGVLSFDALRRGTSNVSVTANDGKGGMATHTVAVTVGNSDPVVSTSAPNSLSLMHDADNAGTRTISDSDLFADVDTTSTNADSLTVSFMPGYDTSVVRVSRSGEGFLFTTVGQGSTSVTLRAEDDMTRVATHTIQVTVNDEPMGNAVERANVTLNFGTGNNTDTQLATFNETIASCAAAIQGGSTAISVSGEVDARNNMACSVTVTAQSRTSAAVAVNVTATDSDGRTSEPLVIMVTVENSAPTRDSATLDDLALEVGASTGNTRTAAFSDVDVADMTTADTLEYSVAVESTPPGAVTVANADTFVSSSTITVNAVSQGTATVTITARDDTGTLADGTQTFSVTVNAPATLGTVPKPNVTLRLGAGNNTDSQLVGFNDPMDSIASCPTNDSEISQLTVTAEPNNTAGAMGCDVTITAITRTSDAVAVTVRAMDGTALSAPQTIMVTVANSAPVAGPATTPASLSLMLGATNMGTVTAAFSDADADDTGHTLTYSAEVTRGTGIVTVSPTRTANNTTGIITVTAVAQGTATVTITATDDRGATDTQTFEVGVNDTPMVVDGGVVGGNVTLNEVGETRTASRLVRFDDTGDTIESCRAVSDTPASVSIMGDVVPNADPMGCNVTVQAQINSAGQTVTIRVYAMDGSVESAAQTFSVTVNRPPAAGPAINEVAITINGTGTQQLAFTDPDGGDNARLTYAHSVRNTQPADANVVEVVSISETGLVTLRGLGVGTADVRVTATDSNGGITPQVIPVRVNPAPTESSSSDNSAIIAIVIAAGAYAWWKQRQIANGNAAAVAFLPDVTFDLDRKDNRAFYTKMDWKNAPGSNWQLRGNATMHTKYSGELLDWKADSHIGYQLRGDWGSVNPYAKARYVNNNPHEEAMQETYTYGLNLSLRNRVNIQIVQPDSEVQRYSLNTQWQLPNRFSLRIAQPNSEVENYSLGLQWQGKRKIRYSLQGDIKDQSENNVYRLISTYTF